MHSYDLEEEATEVQWMLPGSKVSHQVFLTVGCCTLNIKFKFHLETQDAFLTFS